MEQVPASILEAFQKKFSNQGSHLTPFHQSEEGSDGVIYRFSGQETLLKICPLNADELGNDRLRFAKRLDFLSFLFEKGVPVVELVPSTEERLFEINEDDHGCWVAYGMKRVQGRTPSPKIWDPDFIEAWGTTLGKLHRATQEYPEWKNTLDSDSGEALLSWESEWKNFYHLSETPEIQEAWQSIYEEMKSFPLRRDVFGMVHNDPHLWNVHWDGYKAILLDFEVANHHWFVNDIAIACQHVLFMLSGGMSQPMHHPERLVDFLRIFLKGYSRENRLPNTWYERLEPFFAYRRLLLYTVMSDWRSSDPELQKSWQGMILSRPDILSGISLSAT